MKECQVCKQEHIEDHPLCDKCQEIQSEIADANIEIDSDWMGEL